VRVRASEIKRVYSCVGTGQVTLYFASGDRYEGEKRGNKFEGFGKYFYSNKDRYVRGRRERSSSDSLLMCL
jgi:hypothetical protein